MRLISAGFISLDSIFKAKWATEKENIKTIYVFLWVAHVISCSCTLTICGEEINCTFFIYKKVFFN